MKIKEHCGCDKGHPETKPVPIVKTIRKIVRQARKRKVMGEEHPMLNMDPHSFDQSSRGWRSLPQNQQQQVLRSYISKHVGPGGKFSQTAPKGEKTINPSTLRWHLGQVQAMAGKKGDAVRNMERSKQENDPQWNRYVGATTSFIKGDREGFDRNAAGRNYNKPTTDRLKKGWGKDYKNAY